MCGGNGVSVHPHTLSTACEGAQTPYICMMGVGCSLKGSTASAIVQ